MPEGAKDFTPGVLKDYDDEVGALVRNTRNTKAQTYLNQQLLGHRNDLATSALGLELKERRNHQSKQFNDTLTQGKAAVLADPNAYAGWLGTLDAMIDNLEDGPTARAARRCTNFGRSPRATVFLPASGCIGPVFSFHP